MENIHQRAKEIVEKLTLEEKAGLCSGSDMWHTKAVERLGLPEIMVSDGPHGLRKQGNSQDNFGIGVSVKATCFPTASLSACSFDVDLMKKMGGALGRECITEDVSVLLGPGVNIKRSPLCGRNFEYFSEDPLVAGKMAAGFINGVQGVGIGCSLKHFAANNQERRRMSVNAVVDKRAMDEIYLRPFEIAVKESSPYTIMCSYNKLNGFYNSENKWLLKEVLREKWGYNGLTVSDWGAVHLRPLGISAGLDLEMPGNGGINDRQIVNAVKKGKLSVGALDECARHVVELVLRCTENTSLKVNFNKDELVDMHHKLAAEIARESMVLAKNDGNLPLSAADFPIEEKELSDSQQVGEAIHNTPATARLAVIGAFAKKPRYQGAGSSKINPIKIESPLESLTAAGISYTYAPGYNLSAGGKSGKNKKDSAAKKTPEELRSQAVELASAAQTVLMFVGLTDGYETEGLDRSSMEIPPEHNQLVEEVCAVNKNVIVVVMGGSPMELPWTDKVRAILIAYLGGQAVGSAVTDILFGNANPCGKLAETWPLCAEDCLSAKYFPGDRLNVQYRESIFVGYRYFNTVSKRTRWNFGHGLSYTTFEYSNLEVEPYAQDKIIAGDKFNVSFEVENTGAVPGKEICFLWSSPQNPADYCAAKTLCGFSKIYLEPGQKETVYVTVDPKDLGIKAAAYMFTASGSLTGKGPCAGITMDDFMPVEMDESIYKRLTAGMDELEVTDSDYAKILGYNPPLPAPEASRPFTMDNNFEDTKSTWLGKKVYHTMEKVMDKLTANAAEGQDAMMKAVMKEMPFFNLWISSGGALKEGMMKFIVGLFNIGPRKKK